MAFYPIFIIGCYEGFDRQGPAVVASESEEEAVSILEARLKTMYKEMLGIEPKDMRLRQPVTRTDFTTDKKGVIYSGELYSPGTFG